MNSHKKTAVLRFVKQLFLYIYIGLYDLHIY